MKSAEYYFKTGCLKLMSLLGPFLYRGWKIDLNKYPEVEKYTSTSKLYYSLYDLHYHPKIKRLYSFDGLGYPYKFSESKQEVFNPLAVAHYLLCKYNENIINEIKQPNEAFFKHFDYLISKATIDDKGIYWFYNGEDIRAGSSGKFISGITQSMVLSIMIRVYDHKPDDDLKKLIMLCYNTLFISVYKHGVLKFMRDGFPWIEEYPLTGPRYVLNGFLFAIIALMEFENTFKEIIPTIPSSDFLDSFIKKYPKFRVGGQLKYSLHKRTLCNIRYKGLHAWQLFHLSTLTDNKAIHTFLEEWVNNVNWGYYKRTMKLKKVVKPENCKS